MAAGELSLTASILAWPESLREESLDYAGRFFGQNVIYYLWMAQRFAVLQSPFSGRCSVQKHDDSHECHLIAQARDADNSNIGLAFLVDSATVTSFADDRIWAESTSLERESPMQEFFLNLWLSSYFVPDSGPKFLSR
jgi:hypothetical protein